MMEPSVSTSPTVYWTSLSPPIHGFAPLVDDEFTPTGDGDDVSDCSLDHEITTELGLSEEHFAERSGETVSSLTTEEDLSQAIQKCKDMIMDAPESSQRRHTLVKKLVELRFKLQEMKDAVPLPEGSLTIRGHTLLPVPALSRWEQIHCERCAGLIWLFRSQRLVCSSCGYVCHAACAEATVRRCPAAKVSAGYELSICPERGLSRQKFRCAECKISIAHAQRRLCDYTGLYYCLNCHWGDTDVIPARVIHNWDFEPRPVCRWSKQFLMLMEKKAVLPLQDLNSNLFCFDETLNSVKRRREEIMVMERYLLSCRNAMKEKLLRILQPRGHFVENFDVYSMDDLIGLLDGSLLLWVEGVCETFRLHITKECPICIGQGHFCAICNHGPEDNETVSPLFPFSSDVSICPECGGVFHRECYVRVKGNCVKCQRRRSRSEGGFIVFIHKQLYVCYCFNMSVETFKKPLPRVPFKRRRQQTVLEEEKYVQHLTQIIERDFFPDLESLRLKSAYLEAVKTNDLTALRALYSKFTGGKAPPTAPSASPATFETPERPDNEPEVILPGSCTGNKTGTENEKPPEDDSKCPSASLNSYLASHTSEDNEGFEQLMEEGRERMKRKCSWAYDFIEAHPENNTDLLALPSIEVQADQSKRPNRIMMWPFKGNQALLGPAPEGLGPDEGGNSSSLPTIQHSNTRLDKQVFDMARNQAAVQEAAASREKQCVGRIGVDGKEVNARVENEAAEEKFSMVRTPELTPSRLESPLMTWGEMEGTPFLLDGSPLRTPTPGPAFRLPETSKRDQLALALAEKVSAQHRDKKRKAMDAARSSLTSPAPSPLRRRPSSALATPGMSPSALRLARSAGLRIGPDASPLLRSSVGGGATPKTPRTPKTPLLKQKSDTTSGVSVGTPNSSLTDNLLNLPSRSKRAKAADFF